MQSSRPLTTSESAARVQVSEKFHLWLDEPADWSLKMRRLRLSGWCVAKKGPPLTAIRARVAGKIFDGRFDRDRPEVAEFVGVPDAPRWCGFTVDVEVPRGRKRLELQVAAADGSWHKAFARNVEGPLRVSEAERKLWQQIEEAEAQHRYAFFFSRPSDWRTPVRKLYIAGWCVDREGRWIRAIRALVADRIFTGNYGIFRPDVAELFPAIRTAERSGFALAAELPPGPHRIVLQLKGADGEWRTFHTAEVIGGTGENDEAISPQEAEYFEASTPEAPRFQYWFDRPRDWTQRVRHLHISGWCIAASGEQITQLRARIRGKSFPAAYGILRPDVAATFDTGPAALRSGFSMDVVVPWGAATLVLEAQTQASVWEEFFRAQVHGPLLWSRTAESHEQVGNYAEWIRLYDRVTRRDAQSIRRQIAAFPRQPKISILLPVYNTDRRWLRRAIDSVRRQLYRNWELCIVDDASTAPHVSTLLQWYARRDPRIKIHRRAENGHIAAASNDALALATGEYVALLDHDDELALTALYFSAREFNEHPEAQLLYSDEDKLDKQGRRCDPYFKPDWNPDLFTSQNYVSHLSVYATELVRKVGGFRRGFEGSQDYDLALRCIEQIEPAQIRHIPHVLYHWRIADESTATFAGAKPYAHEAAVRAMQEHVDRRGIQARVVPHYANYLRVIYSPPPDQPHVSIIIPTRDRGLLLRQCVESIFAKTDYPNFDIVIVDNESTDAETLAYLEASKADSRVVVLRVAGEFNFSRLNNIGVAHARGAFVALLNNDLEVMRRDWLVEMVSHAARPEVGVVGARLWYPDGRMQHGGVILGVGGVATHAHSGIRKEHGYFARAHLTQNFSAVTGACMLLRKEVYLELGGLDEVNLAVAFNDVDFCLRLRQAGLSTVWTPHAELVHHESASRGLEDTRSKQRRFLAEVDFMQTKWGHILTADPFYNPNLSIESNREFKLAFPPRITKPWQENPL